MDLLLFITGLVAMVIAIGLLLVSFFTRGPKKKLFILLGIGFIVLITGALIGGANMTPEEIAANEERKLARAEKKEAKLEAERLEKEELEKEEKAEIKRKKDEQERIKELEKQIKIEESNQIEKEKLEKKEKELNEREQALMKREQEEPKKKKDEKEEKVQKNVVKTLEDISDEEANTLYSVILSMILGSDGRINDVRPDSNDDWNNTNIYVSNEWHSLSKEEQKTVSDTLGGEIRDTIIDVGLSDEPKINFIDEDGKVVAYSTGDESFSLNK